LPNWTQWGGKNNVAENPDGITQTPHRYDYLGREPITNKSPDKRARLGIGYVPQGREIIPRLTVKENLLLGLESRRSGRSGREEIPEDIFALFPVLKTMLSRMGGDLSGWDNNNNWRSRVL
jgi:urea transport system ATP-binding protein